MNDKEIQEKYERSFKELTDTLSPQQIKLFECWFEVACLLYTTKIVENRSLGLQEGLRIARELISITGDEEFSTVSQQKHHLLVNSSRENTNYQ